MDFSQAKIKFDKEYLTKDILKKSLCTVDGKFIDDINLKDVNGKPNEEFYKWEFIYKNRG